MFCVPKIRKIVLILPFIIVASSAAPQLSFHSPEAYDTTVFDNDLLHFPSVHDWNKPVIPQELPEISFGFTTRKTIKRIRFPDDPTVTEFGITR